MSTKKIVIILGAIICFFALLCLMLVILYYAFFNPKALPENSAFGVAYALFTITPWTFGIGYYLFIFFKKK